MSAIRFANKNCLARESLTLFQSLKLYLTNSQYLYYATVANLSLCLSLETAILHIIRQPICFTYRYMKQTRSMIDSRSRKRNAAYHSRSSTLQFTDVHLLWSTCPPTTPTIYSVSYVAKLGLLHRNRNCIHHSQGCMHQQVFFSHYQIIINFASDH